MKSKHNRRDFMKLTIAAGTPLALGASPGSVFGQTGEAEQDGPLFFPTVRSRRSVRQFLPTPVPEEHLREILDVARLAPTSGK